MKYWVLILSIFEYNYVLLVIYRLFSKRTSTCVTTKWECGQYFELPQLNLLHPIINWSVGIECKVQYMWVSWLIAVTYLFERNLSVGLSHNRNFLVSQVLTQRPRHNVIWNILNADFDITFIHIRKSFHYIQIKLFELQDCTFRKYN